MPVILATADAAHARIAVNHSEVAGRDRIRRRGVRRAVASLALAAGLVVPVAAMATPASAAGGGCSSFWCGGSGNHNEVAARDRRRQP
jgi:hypothetical protein